MTDTDGPPDPQLDPLRSPGMGVDVDGLEDIEVSRDDITIGDADPHDLTAGDTEPVDGASGDSLVATLLDENAGDVHRRRAVIALADHEPTETVVDALVHVAREDEDADVRQFAVETLSELGADVAADVALAALYDEDPWVRAEAVVVLDHTDRLRYADRIESCLRDQHEAVRRNALIALWKLRGEEILDTALDFVDDESSRVREWVATILQEIDDERTHEPLSRLADDEDDVVAKAALGSAEDAASEEPPGAQLQPETDRFDTPPDL